MNSQNIVIHRLSGSRSRRKNGGFSPQTSDKFSGSRQRTQNANVSFSQRSPAKINCGNTGMIIRALKSDIITHAQISNLQRFSPNAKNIYALRNLNKQNGHKIEFSPKKSPQIKFIQASTPKKIAYPQKIQMNKQNIGEQCLQRKVKILQKRVHELHNEKQAIAAKLSIENQKLFHQIRQLQSLLHRERQDHKKQIKIIKQQKQSLKAQLSNVCIGSLQKKQTQEQQKNINMKSLTNIVYVEEQKDVDNVDKSCQQEQKINEQLDKQEKTHQNSRQANVINQSNIQNNVEMALNPFEVLFQNREKIFGKSFGFSTLPNNAFCRLMSKDHSQQPLNIKQSLKDESNENSLSENIKHQNKVEDEKIKEEEQTKDNQNQNKRNNVQCLIDKTQSEYNNDHKISLSYSLEKTI